MLFALMFAALVPSSKGAGEIWGNEYCKGTAPSCAASCGDCGGDQCLGESGSCGGGSSCWTGTKAKCRPLRGCQPGYEKASSKSCASCPNGKYKENDGASSCSSCDCPNGQDRVGNCGGNRAGSCEERKCVCNSGTAARGSQCPASGEAKCVSCNSGFELNNHQCHKKCSAAQDAIGGASWLTSFAKGIDIISGASGSNAVYDTESGETKKLTLDGVEFTVPKFITASSAISESTSVSSRKYSSMEDITDSMYDSLGVSGEVSAAAKKGPISGSAKATMSKNTVVSKAKNAFSSSNTGFVASELKKSIMSVEATANNAPLSEGFKKDVIEMKQYNPKDNLGAWKTFFVKYGTHTMTKAKVGGRVSVTHSYDKSKTKGWSDNAIKDCASAKAEVNVKYGKSALSVSGGAKAAVDKCKSSSSKSNYQEAFSAFNTEQFVEGGDPSTFSCGNADDAWARYVKTLTPVSAAVWPSELKGIWVAMSEVPDAGMGIAGSAQTAFEMYYLEQPYFKKPKKDDSNLSYQVHPSMMAVVVALILAVCLQSA